MDALQVAASAEDDPMSRSELVRRIVTEWLDARAKQAPASDDLLDHEDRERRQQANVDATRRSAQTRKAGATIARAHADTVADAEMEQHDAPVEEKTRRRKVLTDEPAAAVVKARGKRKA